MLATNRTRAPPPPPTATGPADALSPMALSMGNDYLTKFIIKSNKKEKGNGKESTVKPEKPHFKLQVTAKFDEKLLAEYFACNCDLAVLRDATFEWMDEEWLLIKPAAGKYARQNTVVKLLQTPEARAITTVLDIDTTPLDDYLTKFLVREDEKGTKNYFELHVNAKFNEKLLEECFKLVGTDENLRSAELEWLDGERVLVKCKESIRKNALIRALRTEEARAIVSVYHIQDADLGNREAFKNYAKAKGHVITPEAYALVEEKLEQQKHHNTRLTNEASEAQKEITTLKAENAALKAAHEEETTALEEKITTLNAENTSLQKAHEATAAADDKSKVEIKRLQCHLKLSKADYYHLDKTNKAQCETILKKGKEINALTEEIAALEAKVQELNDLVNNAQEAVVVEAPFTGTKRARTADDTSSMLKLHQTLEEQAQHLRCQLQREQAIADEARAAAEAVRERLHGVLVQSTINNTMAQDWKQKAKHYKKQRDQASHRQRTASCVVAKFLAATKPRNPDKTELQKARALACRVRNVINRFDWAPEPLAVQQPITDMLVPMPTAPPAEDTDSDE